MNKISIASTIILVSLTGCSSNSSVTETASSLLFGSETGGTEQQEAAASLVSDAASSSNPERTIVNNVIKKGVGSVASATAATIDNNIANSKTDISVTGIENDKTRYAITNVTGIFEGEDGHSQSFVQTSLGNSNERAVLNVGLGHRILSGDELLITGFNAFFDYDADYGHQRASLGLEVKSTAIEFTANNYKSLTKWKKGKNGKNERVLDGYDIELGMQVPYIPSAKLYLKNWKWEGVNGASDTKGNTYSIGFSHLVDGVSVELGRKDYEGSRKGENFGQLTYSVPIGNSVVVETKPFIADKMFEQTSMKNKMLENVRRNNSIVVQTQFTAAVGGV